MTNTFCKLPTDLAADISDYRIEDSCGLAADYELDLRGVACPMNFVKSKLKLETMEIGEVLSIILDDGEPAENVPTSLSNEEQIIEDIEDLDGGHCRVVVRKAR